MSDPAAEERQQTPSSESDDRPSKPGLTPAKAGLGFLLLIMVGFIVAQFTERGGQPIEWVYDLDQALTMAKERDCRVFVYAHAPECKYTARYDRGLFKQRIVRDIVARMVPLRLELASGASIPGLRDAKGRPVFMGLSDGEPIMTMLDSEGTVLLMQPRSGAFVDAKEFTTYIHYSADR